MLRKVAASYHAGYFDADGCVSVSLNKTTINIKVSISGRNIPLANQLNTIFGGNVRTNASDVTTWYAYSDNARDYLTEVAPYVKYKEKQTGMALKVLDPLAGTAERLMAALSICVLNQHNLAEPQITKTMEKLKAALEKMGVEVDYDKIYSTLK
jgi:hypothetical protein